MEFAKGYVSDGIMNLTDPFGQWLVSIHELTNSKQTYLAYAMPAYYMEITDVFLDSALACDVLLNIAPQKPAEKGRNRKATIYAIIISLSVICILLLSVWLIPFTPFTWLKNHPNSYPLQGSIICLIPCVVVGFLKQQWRKWCWGSAVAFVVLILSLA